jgi:hypothetical protein
VDPWQGPAVRLVATFPADGAGLECLPDDPPACGVRVDTPIQLRFDRFLNPASVNRQAFRIYTGSRGNLVGSQPPEPLYDVVERVVTIRLAPGDYFQPHTLYTVELVLHGPEEEFGFHAVDAAPMATDSLRFDFYTSGLTPEELATEDPLESQPQPVPPCNDVLSWFDSSPIQGQCAACHDELQPPMGLQLHSGEALRRTAIDRVAHQTDIGPITGESYENAPRFGVGMPIIAAGQPSSSYLLYKLLIEPSNYRPGPGLEETCDTVHLVDLAGECVPSPEEIARLRHWFVVGEPMPKRGMATGGASFYRPKLQALQAWIRDGAVCD